MSYLNSSIYSISNPIDEESLFSIPFSIHNNESHCNSNEIYKLLISINTLYTSAMTNENMKLYENAIREYELCEKQIDKVREYKEIKSNKSNIFMINSSFLSTFKNTVKSSINQLTEKKKILIYISKTSSSNDKSNLNHQEQTSILNTKSKENTLFLELLSQINNEYNRSLNYNNLFKSLNDKVSSCLIEIKKKAEKINPSLSPSFMEIGINLDFHILDNSDLNDEDHQKYESIVIFRKLISNLILIQRFIKRVGGYYEGQSGLYSKYLKYIDKIQELNRNYELLKKKYLRYVNMLDKAK